MIGGGISYNGKTDLKTIRGILNAAHYCAEIVIAVIVPYIVNGKAYVLQQNNARCHTALHTRDVLAVNNIKILE
jgi:uncharacterized protein (UPF0297 family)